MGALNLPQGLHVLDLSETRVDPSFVQVLTRFENLHTLELRKCNELMNASVSMLPSTLTKLSMYHITEDNTTQLNATHYNRPRAV